MSKLAIIVMLVAAVGMIYGLSKQKSGAAWGKPLAIVCAIVALLLAVAHIFTSGGPSPTQVVEREMHYQRISAEKLGSYLAEKFPNARAVLVLEPQLGDTENRRTNALVEGLKRGFGQQITIVDEVSPDIPQETLNEFRQQMPPMPEDEGIEMPDFEMMPPLEYWFTSTVFNRIIERYKDRADLIVTTIGLPQDLGGLNIGADTPKLALASGSVYELRRAIGAGAIVAAVTYNPKAVYDEASPPSNLDEAFDKRFLLVTTENVQQVASEYGELFITN